MIFKAVGLLFKDTARTKMTSVTLLL